MICRIEISPPIITAYLDGEIDHHSAKTVREEIDMSLDENTPELLIVDFRDVSFMDSSGIGLIMGRYKRMQEIGGEVHITNPSPHIKKVLRLAGMDRLAKIEG